MNMLYQLLRAHINLQFRVLNVSNSKVLWAWVNLIILEHKMSALNSVRSERQQSKPLTAPNSIKLIN
jgi:hypothetical protein